MLNEYLLPLLKQLDIELSEDKLQKLELYWEKVKNAPLNLTSISEDADAALLHFADSLAPLAFDLLGKDASIIDVGTGGGFPSVPLAIAREDLNVLALDSTRKKLTFIQENAPVENLHILHARAEEAGRSELRESFDIACARAVAPLSVVMEYLAPFVKVGGLVIAYKAEPDEEELFAGQFAAKQLGLTKKQIIPFKLSGSQEISRILAVYEKTASTPAKYPRNQARQKPLGMKKK